MNTNRLHTMTCSPLFIALFFLCPLLALGQEKDSLLMDLDPVVVTGTRQELPLRKVAAPVTVVNRATLDQSGQINVLPVLVHRVPGFFLNDRGTTGFGVGPNSGGNISIRGISGTPNNRVLVLIDGQPQYMGIFAHPIADSYLASDIERVEVQRGAASILYGSNAMGGAINLITRKANEEGWKGNGSLGYGSYGTLLANVHSSFRSGKFHLLASINRNQTNGFRKDATDSFKNTGYFIKSGYDLSETYQATAEIQLTDADYFHPGTVSVPLRTDRRRFVRGRVAASFLNSHKRSTGALLLYHNFGDHRFDTGYESKDQNQGITFYQNVSVLPGQTITVGLDYKRFGGTAFNESLPPPAQVGLGLQHWLSETDVYAHVQQSLGTHIHINGGIRKVHHSQFGSTTLPGFGVSWEMNGQTTLKASSSKAFRSPSVVDLFLFPASNEDLKPEELWNHDLGLIHQIGQKLTVEANVFWAEGTNLIVVNPMETPARGRNTGSFTNRGIETQLKYQPSPHWEFIANYCFLDRPANVLFAPRHHLTSQAQLSLGKWFLLPSIQYTHGLNISLDPEISEESYALINLRLAHQLTPSLQLYASGHNLTNTSYEVEQGYPMQGINFLGGIRINI